MKPEERIATALLCGIPDRVPVIPKIWIDLASGLTGTELIDVIKDPFLALKVIVDAGIICCVDGVRQFHFPKRAIAMENEKVYKLDENVCAIPRDAERENIRALRAACERYGIYRRRQLVRRRR